MRDMMVPLKIEFSQLYITKFEAKGVYVIFFVSECEFMGIELFFF
jgi:hypothetical protein